MGWLLNNLFSLIKFAIVPILKNRQGDTSDKNNYRPIAIVTAISKIFELCLRNLIESHLITKDNQFGFKKKHSTVTHVYAEDRLVYKLVEMKNKLAASYESILIKLDDITFSQLGFSKYVTNIMLERYSYNCFVNVCRTYGRP